MLRHRNIGVFAALTLALVMLLSAASVSLAQTTLPKSTPGDVEVTGVVPAVLTVQFPDDVAFGEIPNAGAEVRIVAPMTPFVVTSNLPYHTMFTTVDNGEGTLRLSLNNVFVSLQIAPTGYQQLAGDGYSYDAGIEGAATFSTTFNRSMDLFMASRTSPLGPGELNLTLTYTVSQLGI